jgi:hypothetical protein
MFMMRVLVLFSVILKASYASCPIGAFQGMQPNSCYKFFGTPKSFIESQIQCINENGNLSSVLSSFQNSFITGKIYFKDYYVCSCFTLFYNTLTSYLGRGIFEKMWKGRGKIQILRES